MLALVLAQAACAPAALPAPSKPPYCVAPEQGTLQEIIGTPASRYFVHHPAGDPGAAAATVIFLPGGSGLRRNAERVWETMLEGAKGADAFRIVIPYWRDLDLLDDVPHAVAVLDEVLACYGGDPGQVHLAGFSNGGQAAFQLMLEKPQRFATLLGAPGEFPLPTTPADLAALKGKAVFNGIGELDDEGWHKGVRDAHEALTRVGVESVYAEFTGQRHSAGAGFPKDLLFDFWLRHSAARGS